VGCGVCSVRGVALHSGVWRLLSRRCDVAQWGVAFAQFGVWRCTVGCGVCSVGGVTLLSGAWLCSECMGCGVDQWGVALLRVGCGVCSVRGVTLLSGVRR
jgi:hypothetical protein